MNAVPQIGWVGLGSMGSRMAPNLVNGGYSVTGFDLDRSRMASGAAQGLTGASSLSMLAAASDVLFSMIPNDEAFLDVVRHVCGTGKAGACLIDMSTISPDVSARGAALLDAGGISYLRAWCPEARRLRQRARSVSGSPGLRTFSSCNAR